MNERSLPSRLFLTAVPGPLLFLAIALLVLFQGHVHEDAYILFIYAENLARDGVIAYFQGGPPAEGATDFLWMIAIALANLVGVDSALAAAVINAFGLCIIALLIALETGRISGSPVVAILFSLALPFTAIAAASYAGFSAGIYAALVLVIVHRLLRADARGLMLVPLLSLLLGLIRPDGVIIGVVATLLALALCPREQRLAYVRVMLATGLLGIAYFIGRWLYFGQTLPLPLYVKSASHQLLPGLKENWRWLQHDAWLVAAAASYFFVFARDKGRLFLAGLPVVALLAALSFAVQSQNVEYRFQAPAVVVALFLTALLAAHSHRLLASRSRVAALAVVGMLAVLPLWAQAKSLQTLLTYLGNDDYINDFPHFLRDQLDADTVIALTEAGRAAYWLPGKKYDLVGLNTVHTAKHGADVDYLRSLKPDIVFLHVVRTVEFPCDDPDFCSSADIDFPAVFATSDHANYAAFERRVRRAPLAAFAYFLQEPETYDYFTVRLGSEFSHLWAIRRDTMDRERFEAALQASHDPQQSLSYWQMKGALRGE